MGLVYPAARQLLIAVQPKAEARRGDTEGHGPCNPEGRAVAGRQREALALAERCGLCGSCWPPKRCLWRVRVPEAAEPDALLDSGQGPRTRAPDKACRAEGTVAVEGLAPEAELGNRNKGQKPNENT